MANKYRYLLYLFPTGLKHPQVCCYDHEFFGGLSFEDFCSTCFSELKQFCTTQSKTLHMTQLSRALLGFGRSSVQRLPNSKSFLNLIQQCFGFNVCFFLVLECHNSIHPFQTKIAKGMVQGRGHCVHIGISRVMNWRGVEHDERIIQASFP
jgi:hypothetical protein